MTGNDEDDVVRDESYASIFSSSFKAGKCISMVFGLYPRLSVPTCLLGSDVDADSEYVESIYMYDEIR